MKIVGYDHKLAVGDLVRIPEEWTFFEEIGEVCPVIETRLNVMYGISQDVLIRTSAREVWLDSWSWRRLELVLPAPDGSKI